jgi:hypothetical protein
MSAAGEQNADNGFQVSRLSVGLTPDSTLPAKIIHHKVNILIVPVGIIDGVRAGLRIPNSTQRTEIQISGD